MKWRGLPNGRIHRLITCREQYMKCYIIKSNKLVNNPITKQVPRYNICRSYIINELNTKGLTLGVIFELPI